MIRRNAHRESAQIFSAGALSAGSNPPDGLIAQAYAEACDGFRQWSEAALSEGCAAPSQHLSRRCSALNMLQRSSQGATAPATNAGVPRRKTTRDSTRGARRVWLRSWRGQVGGRINILAGSLEP